MTRSALKGSRKTGERGNAMLESALVIVPLMMTVLGVCELGRAMWTYHTLARAVKVGTRFAAVHGARCADASTACPVSVAKIVDSIQKAGIGLEPAKLQLTFTAGETPISCEPASTCTANATIWPSAPANAVGQTLSIKANYTFSSVLSTLWPGQGSASFKLAARSTEVIEF
jgi:Flp pilus assembly protein TadG